MNKSHIRSLTVSWCTALDVPMSIHRRLGLAIRCPNMHAVNIIMAKYRYNIDVPEKDSKNVFRRPFGRRTMAVLTRPNSSM